MAPCLVVNSNKNVTVTLFIDDTLFPGLFKTRCSSTFPADTFLFLPLGGKKVFSTSGNRHHFPFCGETEAFPALK